MKFKVRLCGERDCTDKVFDTKREAVSFLVASYKAGSGICKFTENGHRVWAIKR